MRSFAYCNMVKPTCTGVSMFTYNDTNGIKSLALEKKQQCFFKKKSKQLVVKRKKTKLKKDESETQLTRFLNNEAS